MAAGDFSASQLPNVLAKQQEIFLTGGRLGIRKNDPRVNAAKAVFENQTAVPLPIMKGDKCVGVEATFLKYCDDTVVDCADEAFVFSCDITGAEGESLKQEFNPNFCFQKSFTVNDNECKDAHTATEKIAEGIVNLKLALEAELSTFIINELYGSVSPASDYEGEAPAGWDLTGTPYEYPAAAATRALTLSQMYVISQINRIMNPVMIGDGTWQADVNLAQFLNNQGGAIYDEAGLYGQWGKWYFDPIALAGAGAGTGKLIMFDPNSVLAWTKNDVTNLNPQLWLGSRDLTNWKEPLSFVKGRGMNLYYDAWMQEACIEGADGVSRRKGTKVQLILRGGFHVAQGVCNANDTGVYLFTQNA